jgi:hypothetical protein
MASTIPSEDYWQAELLSGVILKFVPRLIAYRQ